MPSVLRENLTGIVIASLPGLVFIGLGIYGIIINRRRRRRETVRAVGKVLYLDSHESRSGKYRNVVRLHDSPVVEFNVDGTLVKHESELIYSEGDFEVGEVVELFYDLNDPSRFHLEKHYEREAFTAKLFLKIGLGWSVIAAVIAWLGGRRIAANESRGCFKTMAHGITVP